MGWAKTIARWDEWHLIKFWHVVPLMLEVWRVYPIKYQRALALVWLRHLFLWIRVMCLPIFYRVVSLSLTQYSPGRLKWHFREINFQANLNDWWLRYLLWNCPQMNVIGTYLWQVNISPVNALVPPRQQAITWTNIDPVLFTRPQ